MMLRKMMLAATLLAVPVAAMAQPVSGIYIGAGAGYNYMQDWTVNSTSGPHGTGAAVGSKLKGGGGPVGLGFVGYGLGNGFRVEVEGDWRDNDASGNSINTFGGMVNGLYDFNIGMPWLYPYVGAGVGYQRAQLSSVTGKSGGTTVTYGGNEGGVGVQGILGVSVPVSMAPGLSFTAEYIFMAALGDHTESGTAVVGGVASPASVKLGNLYNHAGVLGLRYAFGVAPAPAPAPAPVPAAAPAPAPARTYLVFFDWDKSDLTARARQIIADAAQASTRVAVTRIEVSGYADRTGSAAYNQALSVRRGDAVAAELVRLGVNKAAITVQGFGDTHPLVPTGPNTREPQNRRVEIVLK